MLPRLGELYFFADIARDVGGIWDNALVPPRESFKCLNWSWYCLCSNKHDFKVDRKSCLTTASCCVPLFVFTAESCNVLS